MRGGDTGHRTTLEVDGEGTASLPSHPLVRNGNEDTVAREHRPVRRPQSLGETLVGVPGLPVTVDDRQRNQNGPRWQAGLESAGQSEAQQGGGAPGDKAVRCRGSPVRTAAARFDLAGQAAGQASLGDEAHHDAEHD